MARLQVFISYASEDRELAEKLRDTLRGAFDPRILKVYIDNEIQPGASWRSDIENALDTSDILIIVATGQEKLSHSFTGFEVGYFKASIRNQKKMTSFEAERFIIPISVLTEVLATSENQGIFIDANITPLVLEHDDLRNKDQFSKNIDYDPRQNPFMALFNRIKRIISAGELTEEELALIDRRILESAQELHETVFRLVTQRVWTDSFPERKLIIRFAPDPATGSFEDPLQRCTLEVVGRSVDVFNVDYTSKGKMSFKKFIDCMRLDKSKSTWTEIIKSIITTSVNCDFGENRALVTSSDGYRFFRLFIARSIVYHSGAYEIHAYIVEIKSRDFGEKDTTMLMKAISIGLQYRFMFLEKGSEFSPSSFELTSPDRMREKISDMLQELSYVIWLSNDAQLGESESLMKIFGDSLNGGVMDERRKKWESQRGKLTDAAHRMLVESDVDLESQKKEFIETLIEFCKDTDEMNKDFTIKAMKALERNVIAAVGSHDVGAPRAVGGSGGPSLIAV